MTALAKVNEQDTIHLRVDGDRTTLAEFLTANTEDGELMLDPADVAAIQGLAIGMHHTIYGGASGDTIIKRVKAPAHLPTEEESVDGFIANLAAQHRCTNVFQPSASDATSIIGRHPYLDLLTTAWSPAQREELTRALLSERADGCEEGRRDILDQWSASIHAKAQSNAAYEVAVAEEVRGEMRSVPVHDVLYDFAVEDSKKHGSSAPVANAHQPANA